MKNVETGKNDEMLRQDFQLSHNRDPYFRTMEFHAHDFLELYYFLDGSVTYYIEDQVYDLCPGDLLIIPAGNAPPRHRKRARRLRAHGAVDHPAVPTKHRQPRG